MKKNCVGYAVATGLLVGISAAWPAAASANVAAWQIPDLTNGSLQKAVTTVSALLGDQARLVLLQPGKGAPKDAPANTLYMYPVILKGDLQPVYDLADWEVCGQTPKAGGALALSPKTTISVQIVRPQQGCK
jgi:hypothetical protein